MKAPRRFQKYDKSNLSWLSEIPAHWKVKRNGALFSQRNETGHAHLPILEVSLRTGVRVRNFETSKRKQILSDLTKYKRAAKNDIAYNMMRMWQGAVGIAPVDGLVSPAYVVARPHIGVNPEYFSFLFRTEQYMSEIDAFSRGIVKDRNRLYWDQFKQMASLVPTEDEQAAIVHFLNFAVKRIRRAINAKRKVVDLVNEQRYAIIRKVISRGIDQKSKLKPSSISWLGDIPVNWQTRRLKYVTRFCYGNALPENKRISGETVAFGSNGPVGTSSISNTLAPAIIVGRKGSFGKVTYSERPAFAIDTTYFIDNRNTSNDLKWLYYLLQVIDLDKLSQDTGVPGLSRESAYQKVVPVPPFETQREIADALDLGTARIDQIIGRIEGVIRCLVEYQNRLISDVVTGKIDIRESVANLPKDIEQLSDDIQDDETPDSEDGLSHNEEQL